MKEAIRERALSLGFDAVGFARADVSIDEEHERYLTFLAEGKHGSMDWLARASEVRRRLDTPDILEGARSVVCLARRYARPNESVEAPEGSLAHGIARYARGRDYHTGLRDRVRRLASFIRALSPGVQARPMVDTAPVLERVWAARSGMGFVGKHGLLIVPGQGSYSLLAEVVTTLDLPADEPIAQRCGSCTRCLDACPTQAFSAPFVLDPRRCIAYLTIEHQGPIAPDLRERLGDHVFGCDVCQEVCPFNRAAPAAPSTTEVFTPLEAWRNGSIADVIAGAIPIMTDLGSSTPLRRIEDIGLLRNAIVCAVSGGLTACIPALERLVDHHDEVVREHAQWALSRLRDKTDACQPSSVS